MKNTRKSKKNIGMSLVEMLVVLSIVSVLALASFMMLSSGIDIWKRFEAMQMEDDTRIFIDKLKKDIGAMSKYKNIRINGNSSQFTFPCCVVSEFDPPWLDKEVKDLRQINEISYKYKSTDDSIERYSRKLYKEKKEITVVLRDVKQFKFFYYYRSDAKQDLKQYNTLEEGVIPKFIKIEIKYLYKGKEKEFSEMIEIPFANGV
ncbi:MAG: type II secretion system protein [Candidatus Omnitrophica bacterium]|nr:type II secretion system protein [Candidatus Omnitrophota bacterium]